MAGRSERLAVLQDRMDRNVSDAGDLTESLRIAREASDVADAATLKLAESEGWRSLLQENTAQLRRSCDVCSSIEDLLKPIARKEMAKAKFYETLTAPKVFLPIVILSVLLLAAFVGVVSFEPIRLALPF